MDADIPSQESREDLPSELSFVSAPRETDPMPIVTRPSESARPESTSVMVIVTRTGGPRNKCRAGSSDRTGNRNATGTGNSNL